MCTKIAPNHSKLYFSLLGTSENAQFLFHCCQHTEPWTRVKPHYDWSSDPSLSAKGPFVRFDPVDYTIRDYKAKTDCRNKILEIKREKGRQWAHLPAPPSPVAPFASAVTFAIRSSASSFTFLSSSSSSWIRCWCRIRMSCRDLISSRRISCSLQLRN